MNKRTDGQCVRELSRLQIRKKIQFTMDLIFTKYGDVRDGIFVDIVKIYEYLANDDIKFNFIVLKDDTDVISKNISALAVPEEGFIYLKESVYIGATEGVTSDRLTLAHELSHLILHWNVPKNGFAKSSIKSHHYTQDAEWQADMGAFDILTDHRFLNHMVTANVLSKTAGISLLNAFSRVDELKYLIKK
ncbi:MAG: Zn-dependent peptidase ImmA (M78 family) [Psychroserpens sp.]|jgi:Zn-dependent peptidase ImmA (M78 family)